MPIIISEPTINVNKSVNTPKITTISKNTAIINQDGTFFIAFDMIYFSIFLCNINTFVNNQKIDCKIFNQNSKVLKKNILLIFYFSLCSIFTFGQESPYYQLPKNRKTDAEALTFPNLKPFVLKYYVSASGGFKKNLTKLKTNDNSPNIDTNSPLLLNWEMAIGQNRNNDYFWEIGLVQNYTKLTTSFQNVYINRLPLSFTSDINSYYIPLRVKKRLFYLDKVARTTMLNIGTGVILPFATKKITTSSNDINFNASRNPTPDEIIRLKYDINPYLSKVGFEAQLDLRGKVTERVEVSLYSKYVFIPQNKFYHEILIGNYDGTQNEYKHSLKNSIFQFGVQVQLNSPMFIKYTDDIAEK